MCDLLGLTFSTPITAKISLNIFQEQGAANPDGWGLAFYNDGRLQIIKEARSAIESELYDFMEQYIHSQTIISHVRRSTRGVPSYLNTHPFYRRMILNGIEQEYAFAHNGTLSDISHLSFGPYAPLGETDSERAFCHILNVLYSQGNIRWTVDDFNLLETTLRRINDHKNTLNCLFSDGKHLFCYSDENDHNNGLRYVKQEYPFGKIELIGTDEKIGSIDITSYKNNTPPGTSLSGYIISTKMLTKERWIEFDGGELIVFKEGKIVHPRKRT